MKKKLCSFALLVAACGFGAMAQTMVIVENDGTQHKFNTDYVQEVIFEKQEVIPIPEGTNFPDVSLNTFGSGNVTLTFKCDKPNIELALDTYGATTDTYLKEGEYPIGPTEGNRIDASYSSAKIDGESKNVKSGKMTVTKRNGLYTLEFDIVLDDDTRVVGYHQGTLEGYNGIRKFSPTRATYIENDFPAGEVYVKFEDYDGWTVEAAVSFMTNVTETTGRVLPAGTYTYAEEPVAGNFGPKSYCDATAGLRAQYKAAEGSTVVVTKDGDNYNFDIHIIATDGSDLTITYSGPINPAQ